MDMVPVVVRSASHVSAYRYLDHRHGTSPRFQVRAKLPFEQQDAKYYQHLEAAVHVVQRACRLCLHVYINYILFLSFRHSKYHVKSSLFSTDANVHQKNDQTPVTVADFGVQALISFELNKLFPSIPLVAEEDSAYLRSRNLAGSVLDAITAIDSPTSKPLTQDDVLEAIDRGGKDAFLFGSEPATYWVLDPIDGTRGFVKAGKALYVVGLALVVEGEIVAGVMGCPNWQEDFSKKSPTELEEVADMLSPSGTIMIAHIGCGTWTKRLNSMPKLPSVWTRCFVDGSNLVQKAHFCIPDSQTWESLPLSSSFNATNNVDDVGDNQVLLLAACCGRSNI
ncbi:hypothetical protein Ahy_A10g051010 isoform E [Arachis hypogaea]|uniref:PAP-specific phosphatase, mitochondrial n=1 Tax=Arachis hypogaea TaxID=3818 RepID=A0A445BB65_ARAHY|nr:hypothetical protein Ahy_A10g051010 isoform E [Arachis hypogaea]